MDDHLPSREPIDPATPTPGSSDRSFRLGDLAWLVAAEALMLGPIRFVPEPVAALLVMVSLCLFPALAVGVVEAAWTRKAFGPTRRRFGPRRLIELWTTIAFAVVVFAGVFLITWGAGPIGVAISAVVATIFGRAIGRFVKEFLHPKPTDPAGLRRVGEYSLMGVVVVAGVIMACIIGGMALLIVGAMSQVIQNLFS